MKVDWALLASSAEAPPNGLVYILGAGIDPIVLTIPTRPVPSDHPQGWDLATHIVINLAGVLIAKTGLYNFEIMVDNQQVRTLPFRAADVPRSPS